MVNTRAKSKRLRAEQLRTQRAWCLERLEELQNGGSVNTLKSAAQAEAKVDITVSSPGGE